MRQVHPGQNLTHLSRYSGAAYRTQRERDYNPISSFVHRPYSEQHGIVTYIDIDPKYIPSKKTWLLSALAFEFLEAFEGVGCVEGLVLLDGSLDGISLGSLDGV
jgi:hypothetical protein